MLNICIRRGGAIWSLQTEDYMLLRGNESLTYRHIHLSVLYRVTKRSDRSGPQVTKCSNTTPLCLNQNLKGQVEKSGLQLKWLSKYGTSVKESEHRRSFLQPGQDTAGFNKAQTFKTLLKAVDRTGIILPLYKTAFPNSQFYQTHNPPQTGPAGDSDPC